MGAKVKVRAACPVRPYSRAAAREPIRIKGLSGRDEAPPELRTGHRKGAYGGPRPPRGTTTVSSNSQFDDSTGNLNPASGGGSGTPTTRKPNLQRLDLPRFTSGSVEFGWQT